MKVDKVDGLTFRPRIGRWPTRTKQLVQLSPISMEATREVEQRPVDQIY